MFCVVEEGRDGGEVGSGGRDLLSAPGRDEGNQQEGRVGGGKGGATQQQPFLHICASLSGEHKKMNGE